MQRGRGKIGKWVSSILLLMGMIFVLSPSDSQVRTERPAARARFTQADFERHIAQIKKKYKPSGFSIVIQPPFVVLGDEPPEAVRTHAVRTVKWAVDRLKQDYFTQDPDSIIDIWLFKDKSSYEEHAKAYFNDTPDSPYGYFSPTENALIMNISTGAGTLVHEIVHPFIQSNFPDCPPWFNEGLASLYEHCGENKGHIVGYTNWRLPILQKAISAGLPTFKQLMEMDYENFYHKDRGANYGQARYLCYYLQERGLLVKFFQEFSAHHKTDPSGYASLQKTLGEREMGAFQKRWERFVLKLTYP